MSLIESIKETVRENRGPVAVVGGALLLGMLNFGFDGDVTAPENKAPKKAKTAQRKPASLFNTLGPDKPKKA